MSIDNKSGDSTSVAEELLQSVPELEQKCRAIEKAISEGYLTLPEAFSAYGVTEIEYLPYWLIKNNKKLKKVKKQEQAYQTIYAVMAIFDTSHFDFSILDKTRKALFIDLKKEMTQKPSAQNNIFQGIKAH